MAWFLIVILAAVSLAALFVILVLASLFSDEAEAEKTRIEMEVRRAERRLHDIASNTFQAMLDETRAHDRRVKR